MLSVMLCYAISCVSSRFFPPCTNKLSNWFAPLPCISQQRLLQVSSHLTVSSSSSSVLPLHFPSLGLLSSLPCFQPALPLLFAWVVLWVWQLKPAEGGWSVFGSCVSVVDGFGLGTGRLLPCRRLQCVAAAGQWCRAVDASAAL